MNITQVTYLYELELVITCWHINATLNQQPCYLIESTEHLLLSKHQFIYTSNLLSCLSMQELC